MEIKIRDKLHFPNVTEMMKNLKTVFSKQLNSSMKIPKGVVNVYPYTLSREHKVQALEAELKKAQALAEVQRRRILIL